MSTRATKQPRQPRGVPTGGQWRVTARPAGPSLVLQDDDAWEGWDQRSALVARRIGSYHPDCARRWAQDSLASARNMRERSVSLAKRARDEYDLSAAAELREQALVALAAAEKHSGLGREMIVQVHTGASKETMTSLAGGDAGWCIADDIVAFEQTEPGCWQLSGPEWYMRGHVLGVLRNRDVPYQRVAPEDGRAMTIKDLPQGLGG
jgi:hypothetical protein